MKTDRHDAVAIAPLLRNGEGQQVRVSTPGDEARVYLRCRDDLRQELRRYRQRLQQCLIRQCYVYRGGRNWTQSYWRWLGELQFSEEVPAETGQIYYRRIQELEEKPCARSVDGAGETVCMALPFQTAKHLAAVMACCVLMLTATHMDCLRGSKRRSAGQDAGPQARDGHGSPTGPQTTPR